MPTGIIGATGLMGSYLCEHVAELREAVRIPTLNTAWVCSAFAAENLHDVQATVMKASFSDEPFDIVNVSSGDGRSVNHVLCTIREWHGSSFAVPMDTARGQWLPDWAVAR
jgi:hypothetical protein